MKKIGIIGHFATGKDCFDGQTVKTRTLAKALQNHLGEEQVHFVDTFGGLKNISKIICKTFVAFSKCKNIIMLPAQNGLKLFVPLLKFLNCFFYRKLHYSVIGGWLPEYVQKHCLIGKWLKTFDFIYVETKAMKVQLEKIGFKNIVIVPNFKNIDILSEYELVYEHSKPFKLCTFSRVSKEKGIEDAIEAVKAINIEAGETICTLDIYGKVDSDYENHFAQLQEDFPDYIRYLGCINADDSVNVLKNYYALLFPTYYEGEGFAGTLLDAFSSGVPVIASDWRYNSEFVTHGYDGLVFPTHDVKMLKKSILDILNDSDNYKTMKSNCLRTAGRYLPSVVIKTILDNMC